MCSIAGIIDFENDVRLQEEALKNMQKSLKNRGPDQSGAVLSENAGLLHNRLCVVDIENGRQPMRAQYADETYTLIYNGELYNTEQLRKELSAAGHFFSGHSDTEVVLKAYIEWKDACVEKMNGIFAFAVYEHQNRRLFFARDKFGVKPFFYTVKNGEFYFSSEIKGLLAHPEISARADSESIREILLTGPGRRPGYGVFKDICELPAACRGSFSDRGLKTERYWKLTAKPHTDSLKETIEKVRILVTDAIRRQLVADVPIGTFLSGGLDSSLISSVACRMLKEQGKILKTFSVDYKDNARYFKKSKFQPAGDTEYIKKMQDFLQCEHHMITLDTDELVEALFAAVDARDLPGMADVDASLLLFCKEIRKEVTVALSGECADEIFGGYPWYRDPEIREQEGFPWAQSVAYRAEFLRKEYLDHFDPRHYVLSQYKKTVQDAETLASDSKTDRRMREMMRLNTDWFMQTLLDRKDRMSMYSALEVRVPFCDERIAEYLYSVPWEMKEYKNYEKGLLREAMKEYLPQEVLWRKKSPYPKTHHPAYLRRVSDLLREIIADPASPILNIVRKNALENLLRDDNAQPWYGQLMTTPQTIAYMLQVNYWLQKYKVELI